MPLLDVRRASTAEECLKGMRLAACGTCTGAKAWSCSAGGDHDKDQGGVRERSTECPKLHKQPRRRRAEHVRMKWVYMYGGRVLENSRKMPNVSGKDRVYRPSNRQYILNFNVRASPQAKALLGYTPL